MFRLQPGCTRKDSFSCCLLDRYAFFRMREFKENGATETKRQRNSLDAQQKLCSRYEDFTPMEFPVEIAKTLY